MLLKLLVASGLDNLDSELVCIELNQSPLYFSPQHAGMNILMPSLSHTPNYYGITLGETCDERLATGNGANTLSVSQSVGRASHISQYTREPSSLGAGGDIGEGGGDDWSESASNCGHSLSSRRPDSDRDDAQVSELSAFFTSVGITHSSADAAAVYLAKMQIGSSQMLKLLDKADLETVLKDSGLQPFSVKIVLKSLQL